MSTKPDDPSSFLTCQENYKCLLKNKGIGHYCPILVSLTNDTESLITKEGLLGFYFPRNSTENKENYDNIVTRPIFFYYASVDNEFYIQSYECARKFNEVNDKNEFCNDCKIVWRKVRNISPGKVIKMVDHRKIMKCTENSNIKKSKKYDELIEGDKTRKIAHNKSMNKLIKKVSYWRNKCKFLEESVAEWRKKEASRDGFISVEDEEAEKWHNFYSFIDKKIDEEHFDDEEMRNLHKELIRTETSTLGKFNKRKDKRGIVKTKISSRILIYSLSLANNLGKVNYEKESKIHCLPDWSTITR